MIKIATLLKNEAFLHKVWNMISYDSEIIIYELKSHDEEMIRKLKIDVIIFDFYDQDELKLEQFEKIKENLNIKGICVLGEYSQELVKKVLQAQIPYLCDLTINETALYVLLLTIINENKQIKIPLHDKIDKICTARNLSDHLKGYEYVKTAILYYIENEKKSYRMKDVYDTIAKKYHTTGSRVEKNMRLAIHASGSKLSNARFVNDCYKECIHG